jgi:hypothetical protein
MPNLKLLANLQTRAKRLETCSSDNVKQTVRLLRTHSIRYVLAALSKS